MDATTTRRSTAKARKLREATKRNAGQAYAKYLKGTEAATATPSSPPIVITNPSLRLLCVTAMDACGITKPMTLVQFIKAREQHSTRLADVLSLQ